MSDAVIDLSFESYKDFYINSLPGTELGNVLNSFVFRGHSKEEYTLLPGSLRGDKKFENMINAFLPKYGKEALNYYLEYDQIIGECILLREFCELSNLQGLQIPQLSCFLNVGKDYSIFSKHFEKILNENTLWPPENFWPLMSLAQHYGVPTRFLDWTFDKNVASYFAIEGFLKRTDILKDDNIVIWAINTHQLSTPKSVLRFFVPTYYDNPNLKAQKGLLSCLLVDITGIADIKNSFHRVEYPIEWIYRQYGGKADTPFLYQFKISTKNIKNDFNFLMSLGYSANSLFPGYGGAYKAMEDYMNSHNFIN